MRTRWVLAASAVLVLSGCAGHGFQAGSEPKDQSARAASASPQRSLSSRVPSAGPRRSSRPKRSLRLLVVHDPGRVTGTISGPCRARYDGRLPDRRCTPGAVDPAVSQADIGATICASGYTETVRPPESQTEKFKFDRAYPAYGVAPGTESELDHLVPLELGGANDAANLWPEAGSLPNPKDSVENALNKAVCDGRVGLARAQRAIARNWETAESRLGLAATVPAPVSSSPPAHAGGTLRCAAAASDSSPADYSTVYVSVRTAPGATVTAVAHYKTTDNRKTAVADSGGKATIAYYISGATPGFTVRVGITAAVHAKMAACSTSFTPAG